MMPELAQRPNSSSFQRALIQMTNAIAMEAGRGAQQRADRKIRDDWNDGDHGESSILRHRENAGEQRGPQADRPYGKQ